MYMKKAMTSLIKDKRKDKWQFVRSQKEHATGYCEFKEWDRYREYQWKMLDEG